MDFIYFEFVFSSFSSWYFYFDFATRKDRSNWPWSWHLVTVSALFYRQTANKEKLRNRNESRNKIHRRPCFVCHTPPVIYVCLSTS
jgi:hypothetical protein